MTQPWLTNFMHCQTKQWNVHAGPPQHSASPVFIHCMVSEILLMVFLMSSTASNKVKWDQEEQLYLENYAMYQHWICTTEDLHVPLHDSSAS